VAVGSAVTGLQVGDPVIAVASGTLSSHFTLPARHVVRQPRGMTAVEAATLPLPFLTAYYGLEKLARLQPGQKVLIHAAAGGVGQAAVQWAQRCGAEGYATASPGKWAFLRGMGVERVYNSRTLDSADAVLRDTEGRGVDVVLNSLNGEFIDASLRCLAEGGTFIEIGKIGIWSAEPVQNPECPGIIYTRSSSPPDPPRHRRGFSFRGSSESKSNSTPYKNLNSRSPRTRRNSKKTHVVPWPAGHTERITDTSATVAMYVITERL